MMYRPIDRCPSIGHRKPKLAETRERDQASEFRKAAAVRVREGANFRIADKPDTTLSKSALACARRVRFES